MGVATGMDAIIRLTHLGVVAFRLTILVGSDFSMIRFTERALSKTLKLKCLFFLLATVLVTGGNLLAKVSIGLGNFAL